MVDCGYETPRDLTDALWRGWRALEWVEGLDAVAVTGVTRCSCGGWYPAASASLTCTPGLWRQTAATLLASLGSTHAFAAYICSVHCADEDWRAMGVTDAVRETWAARDRLWRPREIPADTADLLDIVWRPHAGWALGEMSSGRDRISDALAILGSQGATCTLAGAGDEGDGIYEWSDGRWQRVGDLP